MIVISQKQKKMAGRLSEKDGACVPENSVLAFICLVLAVIAKSI